MQGESISGVLALTTGLKDVFNLKPEDIQVWDWAWGLHHTARWSGATPVFWDVLSHTMLVYDLAMEWNGGAITPETKLGILLHDASEAYMTDMPRPIKYARGSKFFRDREDKITNAILDRFGIGESANWELVKMFDDMALGVEWSWFFSHLNGTGYEPNPPPTMRSFSGELADPWEYFTLVTTLAQEIGVETDGLTATPDWLWEKLWEN